MCEFFYEGKLWKTGTNKRILSSLTLLEEAAQKETVLEAICCKCDVEHNLHVQLGQIEGIIPRAEAAMESEGKPLKEIALISKVGKPVQFVVDEIIRKEGKTLALLSRKKVQQLAKKEYIDKLKTGDVLEVKVTHLERFGAFADIAAGISSLIPIDMLSVSRISHPSVRVQEGEVLRCVLKNRDNGKITLSLREMLGTWEENAALFEAGQTVQGIVRSVESYGVFIELAPNLAGLAEYNATVREGQTVSVFIKAIIPEKMKVKLSIIDKYEEEKRKKLHYFFTGEHMQEWIYSPAGALKRIESKF